MKKKMFFILMLSSVMFIACSDKTGGDSRFCKSYIEKLASLQSIRLYQVTVPATENIVLIKFVGKELSQKEYETKLIHYGDVSYNKWRHAPSVAAVADEFLSVDVTSSRAFDNAHPAGTSLADIVKLGAQPLYGFIRNGYSDEYSEYGDNTIRPVTEKLLTDFTLDDLRLLQFPSAAVYPDVPDTFLRFENPPKGAHMLTVTFRTADKTFTQYVTVNFI